MTIHSAIRLPPSALRTLLCCSAALVLCRPAPADILFRHTPGASLYVRVRTAADTSFAENMVEEASGGVGIYKVTDANLLTAAGGSLAANVTPGYQFTVFVGTESTTANDPIVGQGTLGWNGTAERPISATVYDGTGTGEINTASGGVTLKTAAIGSNEIGSTGLDALTAVLTGTADSGTTTTMVDAALIHVNDYWNGATIEFTSGGNLGVQAVVLDFDAATDTVTFATPLPNAVSASDTFRILRTASSVADVRPYGGAAGTFASGRPEIVIQNDGLSAANVAADVGTELATAVWAAATRLLTGPDNVTVGDALALSEDNLAGAGNVVQPIATGTAQSGTSTTIVLAASSTFGDGALVGNAVEILGGTGAGQSRYISGYTGATDTATVSESWTVNPGGDSVYQITSARAGENVAGAILTDVDQEAVPAERTFTLEQTADGLAAQSEVAFVGDTRTWAVDFRKDLPVNGRVLIANPANISIVSGPAGGVTFANTGRDRSQAKVRITPVTAGTYVCTWRVTYDSSVIAVGKFTLIVKQP